MKSAERIAPLVADARPVRPARPVALALGGVAIAVLAVVALDFALFRPDPGRLADPRLVAWAAVLALALTRATIAAIPGRTAPRWTAPCALALLSAALVLPAPANLATAESFTSCVETFGLLAIVPLGVFLFVVRRLAPTDPARAAGRIGLAAGAAAALGVCLLCADSSPQHQLVAHWLPLAALVGLCTVSLRRLLRW